MYELSFICVHYIYKIYVLVFTGKHIYCDWLNII